MSEGARAAFNKACDTPYEYVAQHLAKLCAIGADNYIETMHRIKGGTEMIIASDPRMEESLILLAEEMT